MTQLNTPAASAKACFATRRWDPGQLCAHIQVNSRIWALEKERMAADSTKMAAYVEALHLRRPPSVQVSLASGVLESISLCIASVPRPPVYHACCSSRTDHVANI